ncbi:MAG: ACT domain-containing protein [Candidatus Lokiarchaeota archaeon]|nr:ACT domain-containing protein [Candidatus Lokiarchaeota archaeon]
MIDALKQGVINYKALAENIYDEVKMLLGKKEPELISLDSIQTALIRYADDLRKERELLEERISKVLAKTVLELKNDLVVLTITEEALLKCRDDVFNIVRSARFFHLIQGNSTFTIIADQSLEAKMLALFSAKNLVQSIKDQSGLILISPEEIVEVPGVVSYLHGLLANKNINVTQSISCYKDTILIVNRVEALDAYALVENQILLFRKMLGGRER